MPRQREQPAVLRYDTIASPIGALLVAVCGDALAALDFSDHGSRFHLLISRRFGCCRLAEESDPAGLRQIVEAYFDGKLDAFDRVPLALRGTPFQEQAWQALRSIAPGSVRTYAEHARAIDAPAAIRAVGHANGKNPIAIAVPCHRLVSSTRTLTGYAGGLPRKKWLLQHEGVDL